VIANDFTVMKTADLKPHPLNEKIYSSAEPDEELLASVERHGLLEPLVTTKTGMIISGHRRWSAAKILQLPTVKVRIVEEEQIERLEELLIEFNTYRVKTASEMVREIEHLNKLWRIGQGFRSDLDPTSINIDRSKRLDTRSRIAKKVGLSAGGISKLLFVKKTAPDLLPFIDTGAVSLHQAWKRARQLERDAGYEELSDMDKADIPLDGTGWEVRVGDSRFIELEEDIAQMIICSPPWYGIKDYKSENQIQHEDEETFLQNLFLVFENLKKSLKEDGSLFVELGEATIQNQYLGTTEKFVLGMMERGWVLRERLQIYRPTAPSTNRKKSWSRVVTPLFFFTKTDGDYFFDRDRIRRKREKEGAVTVYSGSSDRSGTPIFPHPLGRTATGLIQVGSDTWMRDLEYRTGLKLSHPAPFPRALVREPLLATTKKNDLVIDCFSGSGTTGVACLEHGRRYLGIEINEVYAKASRVRLQALEADLRQGIRTVFEEEEEE